MDLKKKNSIAYECIAKIEAMMPNRKYRKLAVKFDGIDYSYALELGEKALRKAMRKPGLWHGVGFTVETPEGKVLEGEFENVCCNNNDCEFCVWKG